MSSSGESVRAFGSGPISPKFPYISASASPVMICESSNGSWRGALGCGRPAGSAAPGLWIAVLIVMSMRLISAVIIDQMKLLVRGSAARARGVYSWADAQDAELDVGELRDGASVSERGRGQGGRGTHGRGGDEYDVE